LRQRLSIKRYFVSRTTPLTWNFHFAFPAAKLYRQLPLLRSFSAFVPEPKNRTRLARVYKRLAATLAALHYLAFPCLMLVDLVSTFEGS
jgi:hypothetical protein